MVSSEAGTPIYQSYIGSSANPGYRDFAITAEIVDQQTVSPGVSFDINPTSRQMLLNLVDNSHIASLVQAGARLHQAGCNGCIGMGQAPASGRNSLRTTPRNFPGRSGTKEDSVYLSSPETAAVSALTGVITDPRDMDIPYPKVSEAQEKIIDDQLLDDPLSKEDARKVELVKGPNIVSIPEMDELPDSLEIPILLKVGDNLSTDGILAGGSRVLPYRSNLPEISKFSFESVDPTYVKRAEERKDLGGHAIIGGFNYGQGSSREHAALAPRYLGLRAVIVKDFARIHFQNLINFGILPLRFSNEKDYDKLEEGDVLQLTGLRKRLMEEDTLIAKRMSSNEEIVVEHYLTPRQKEIMLHGGLINWIKARQS